MNATKNRCKICYILILVLVFVFPATSNSITNGSISNMSYPPQSDWKIDHAVVVVNDLNSSIDEFKKAGYTVVPGGEFPGAQTHNALIPFADGSYIEVFAPVDPELSTRMKQLVAGGTFDGVMEGIGPMDKRFMLHLAEEPGVRDFALSAPNLNLTEEPLLVAASGLNLSGPVAMSRSSENGEVKWHVDLPQIEKPKCFSVPYR